MKIDIKNDKVLYVTIGDYEYYIDDSTDEQIMEVHRKDDCEQENKYGKKFPSHDRGGMVKLIGDQ